MGESNGSTDTKIDLKYADNRVAFLISSCADDKRYGLFGLGRDDAKKLIARIQYLEEMSWKQLVGLPRKTGLTSEKEGSESFSMIDTHNRHSAPGEQKHYFHIRIEATGVFRIFGYQYEQFFYITHIDPSGKIHSH